jgi:EAL domain-containing protein (putative c-di-GMP-specific phosphodiesterase class I)
LEHDLHGAVARGELRADYQPIVSTEDGTVVGVEALFRWDHPTRGLVPPATAVPLAEQSGLISDIGRWMLQRACLDRPSAGAGPSDLQVYVNVSARQLVSRGFADTVSSVLDETGTPPGAVTLEVTETVFVDDERRAVAVLDDLKALGVVLALDDFGTGYSSLSYLRRFPVDVLKIDQDFIGQLGRGGRSSKIVSAVVDLAHALGMTVVAEGVETVEQYREVAALGCESSQGYYFARPMSVNELRGRMRAARKGTLRLPRPLSISDGPAA